MIVKYRVNNNIIIIIITPLLFVNGVKLTGHFIYTNIKLVLEKSELHDPNSLSANF